MRRRDVLNLALRKATEQASLKLLACSGPHEAFIAKKLLDDALDQYAESAEEAERDIHDQQTRRRKTMTDTEMMKLRLDEVEKRLTVLETSAIDGVDRLTALERLETEDTPQPGQPDPQPDTSGRVPPEDDDPNDPNDVL